jgi:hypothetical protein
MTPAPETPRENQTSQDDARQVPPCIHTVATGKHEWNTLHSVHQANDPYWFQQCPTCGWIDTAELVEQGRALGLQQERERLQGCIEQLPAFIHSGMPMVERDGQQLSPFCFEKNGRARSLTSPRRRTRHKCSGSPAKPSSTTISENLQHPHCVQGVPSAPACA